MVKIFLLAVAVWLIITVLKRYLRNIEPSSESADKSGANESGMETMVQCAHCGLHLPISDSLEVDSQYYCCEAHSNAAHPADPKP